MCSFWSRNHIHYHCFICRVDSLETMYHMGVYVNDLPLHDASRDLVLQTVHQSAELKLALDSVSTGLPCFQWVIC